MNFRLTGLFKYQIAGAVAAGVLDTVALCQFRAAGTNNPIYITRIEVTLRTAVATRFSLEWASTAAGTPTAANSFNGRRVFPQPDGGNPPLISLNGFLVTAFDVAPTYDASDVPQRLASVPATVPTTILWQWSDDAPLLVMPTDTMTLRNRTGGAAGGLDVSFEFYDTDPANLV